MHLDMKFLLQERKNERNKLRYKKYSVTDGVANELCCLTIEMIFSHRFFLFLNEFT